jgi:hypothetical protein
VRIANRERLRRKIGALPSAIRAELMKALVTSGREINDLQRRFVPVEHGVLAGTIGMLEKPADLQVTLLAGGAPTEKVVIDGQDGDYNYAFAVEFGTKDAPAHPFFFTGYRLGKKRAKSRISRAITAAAKKVAGGA